jgi:hypothetical protein
MRKKGFGPKSPLPLSALVGRVLDPVSAKRGFATAELIAAWPEIVGPRYAHTTQPERISWAHGRAADEGGTLTVRVAAAAALHFQHEIGQILERVNGFLGFEAARRIRIVQKPIERSTRNGGAALRGLDPAEEEKLRAAVAKVDDDGLRAALERLGRGVLASGGVQKGVPRAD